MSYTWKFKPTFAREFSRFPQDQQDKILAFTDIFEVHGLSDFTKYEGKIAPSWSNLPETDTNYNLAFENHLWHYHIGIPQYRSIHTKYKTSDWVLHFQWPHHGNEISLVDVYAHYTSDGAFYLPPTSYYK